MAVSTGMPPPLSGLCIVHLHPNGGASRAHQILRKLSLGTCVLGDCIWCIAQLHCICAVYRNRKMRTWRRMDGQNIARVADAWQFICYIVDVERRHYHKWPSGCFFVGFGTDKFYWLDCVTTAFESLFAYSRHLNVPVLQQFRAGRA